MDAFDERPLVSIITPSYNQAAFLKDALASVLAQEYPYIEYIVIDGGSQDGSVEIIQEYAEKLASWVSERDQGQAEAINKGMARARGQIVAWLNSDDLYLPSAICNAVDAFRKNPQAGFVYSDAITIDAEGHPLKSLRFPQWALPDLLAFRIICQPAVFMRREAFEQAGGLNSDFHFMLDHFLWIRLAMRRPIQHVEDLWAAARHHPMAKNVSQAPGFGREALRLLDWIQQQPELQPTFDANRRKILAGAYRLNGRYLVDGDLPGPALKSYGKAFLNGPVYTLRHWHRIGYAFLRLLGFPDSIRWFGRFQQGHRPRLSAERYQEWPGLTLKSGI